MRALCLFCVLLGATTGWAQSQAVQRALIQRDQQSDEFAQQLRQSQERLQAAPRDAAQQREIEVRQRDERRRLENLDARQRQSVGRDVPAELRPYERQKAADERRRLLLLPPPAPSDPKAAPR